VKTFKLTTVLLFLFVAVPWALWYNLTYDRYGSIDRPAPPVFIQIVTVDAGSINNTLKAKAAEYIRKHDMVRIFVLPMSQEQIGTQEFDIRIIRDGNILHAFISLAQVKEAVEHCRGFLAKVAQEIEGFVINIK